MGVVPETTEDIVVFLCVLVGSSLSVVGAGAQVGCMTFGRRYRKRYWRIVLGHALATLACHLSIVLSILVHSARLMWSEWNRSTELFLLLLFSVCSSSQWCTCWFISQW